MSIQVARKRSVTCKSKHWYAMLVCLGLSRLLVYFVFVFANLASALPCFVVVLMAEEAVDMKTQIDASVAEDQASKAQFLEHIEQRLCDEQFPAGLPQEQQKCADANDISLLVQREEAVAVQSSPSHSRSPSRDRAHLLASHDEQCLDASSDAETAVISVSNAVSGELLFDSLPRPQTSASVAQQVAKELNVLDYQICFVQTGKHYLYLVAEAGPISAELIRGRFPNCQVCERGETGLFSDMFASELLDCSDPKLHLGRRFGMTASGDVIILNCEFRLTTWRQCMKKYDAEKGSSDYKKLVSIRLEEMHTLLPGLK